MEPEHSYVPPVALQQSLLGQISLNPTKQNTSAHQVTNLSDHRMWPKLIALQTSKSMTLHHAQITEINDIISETDPAGMLQTYHIAKIYFTRSSFT